MRLQRAWDGLIVSNHGGRQLDAAPATIEALPLVRQAVGHRVHGNGRWAVSAPAKTSPRAIVAGADFVFLGRAFLYGVAALGVEAGPRAVIDILRDEFDRALTHAGLSSRRRPHP